MSRFDSPVQVVGLFFVASLVSIALIFFINAETEAESRHSEIIKSTPEIRNVEKTNSLEMKDENPTTSNINSNEATTFIKPHVSLLTYLEYGIEKLFKTHRKKRSLRNDSKNSDMFPSSYNLRTKFPNLELESETTNSMRLSSPQGSESVVGIKKTSSSSDNHKIRHAMKKLDEKGLDGVLQIIFDTNSIRESEPSSNMNNYHHENILENNDKIYLHHRRRGEIPSEIINGNGKNEVELNRRAVYSQEKELQQQNIDEDSKIQKKIKFVENNNSKRKPKIFQSETDDDDDDEYSEYIVSNEHVTVSTTVDTKITPSVYHEKVNPSIQQQSSTVITKDQNSLSLNLNHSHNFHAMDNNILKMKDQGQNKSIIVDTQNLDVCYKTDDVLLVIAITCCLNFTFVLIIWAFVKWFSSVNIKDIKMFQRLDCEDGGDSTTYHDETVHNCWVPEIYQFHKNQMKGNNNGLASNSLYTFRPDIIVPHRTLRRSYSMEDFHFSRT